MGTTLLRAGAALLLWAASSLPAAAELPADQIARLGADLTPLGGERAGNEAGSIPAWTGGIVEPPEGYVRGEHHRDPFAGDEPLLVIDASNLDAHRDRLSAGHQRMLEAISDLPHDGLSDPGAARRRRNGSTRRPAARRPPRGWRTAATGSPAR